MAFLGFFIYFVAHVRLFNSCCRRQFHFVFAPGAEQGTPRQVRLHSFRGGHSSFRGVAFPLYLLISLLIVSCESQSLGTVVWFGTRSRSVTRCRSVWCEGHTHCTAPLHICRHSTACNSRAASSRTLHSPQLTHCTDYSPDQHDTSLRAREGARERKRERV